MTNEEKKPICVNCKYYANQKIHSDYCYHGAIKRKSFVTGNEFWEGYELCILKNKNGECKDYKSKWDLSKLKFWGRHERLKKL